MYKKLLTTLSYLGLSFKRELLIFIMLNVAMIALVIMLVIFKVTNFIIFLYASVIPFIDYFYLSRYQDLRRKMDEKHNSEFVSLLSYFEIFISNHNNVYQSFSMLIPYSSEWMQNRLEKLLGDIDQDKSVTPYIRFSESFSYLVIQNVMISIFQMVEQGENESSLLQFDYVFASLNNTLMEDKIHSHEKNIESLTAFPLIGAGILVITLTLTIISLLGDLTNVI